MIEDKPANLMAFHLAGIVPVAGYDCNFGFEWHDCLMPVAQNYTAIEHAIMECAWAGCETIWIVCNNDMQPLLRYRLGEVVQDPVWYGKTFSAYPTRYRKPIPIYYTAIHPKYRNKIDSYAWSALFGSSVAHRISRQISRWTTPDKYYVSFPFGMYPPEALREHRAKISSETNFFLSHNGKTVKDGEFLGFSFGTSDFKACKKHIYKETTRQFINSGTEIPSEKLPYEKRWSARYFSLDKVFEPVIIEDTNVIELPWYYPINNWQNYRTFLGSEESETITRPYEGIIKYREWNGIGIENNEDDKE
tara:strand:- start:2102 stop:3016 length:915 start_codon:yes stop_codon:yes gene_type:complete